tara:strand:+ start:129 stop:893 length:765 start_codon:yes stop_codon:yes gene_type:complete
MFNTYVINLDKDKDKWNLVESRLKAANLSPIRYAAVDAKTPEHIQKYNYKLSNFARFMCPKVPMAIGLSHLSLIEHIYKTDPNDFALIVEDDVVPNVNDVMSNIYTVINGVNDPLWDIIKLHYFFYTNKSKSSYKNYKMTCSAAAYLISKKGLEILSKELVYYHYDLQINFANLRIYKSPQKLFATYELDSSSNRDNHSIQNMFKHVKIPCIETPNDRGLDFWFGFKAIRVFDIELSILELIILVIIVILILRK